MALKSYNGFTGEQREAQFVILKQMLEAGELQKAFVCKRCGQTQGILQYHCEDYSLPVTEEKIEHLCWRCHMIWHSRFRCPGAAKKYFEEVAAGKTYPPVFSNNFKILQENGI